MTDPAVHIILAVIAGVASVVAVHAEMMWLKERSTRERLSQKYETLKTERDQLRAAALHWLRRAPEQRSPSVRRMARRLEITRGDVA